MLSLKGAALTSTSDQPAGAIGLADAIEALRAELTQAMNAAPEIGVRFKPSSIELTVEVALTKKGEGSAGIKWWLIEMGGKASRESIKTQTLKLTLQPVRFRKNSSTGEIELGDLLVSDTEEQQEGTATSSTEGEPE